MLRAPAGIVAFDKGIVRAIICGALFSVLLGVGCGHHSSVLPGDSPPAMNPDASGAGGSSDASTGTDADTAPTLSPVASNGVPIPAFPVRPQDRCQPLGVEVTPCPTTGDCNPVSCNCDGTTLPLSAACLDGKLCLASVSCPGVCALGERAANQVVTCQLLAPCQTSDQCAKVKCVVPSSGATGHCQSDYPGAPCYGDSDCAAPFSCVVLGDGSASCQDGSLGAYCNQDSQCVVKSRCLLASGAFAGQCSNGADTAPCLTDHDCELPLSCVASSSLTPRVCSTENTGEPCTTDDACRGYFCVNGTCARGSVGEKCNDSNQCQANLICAESKCSAGAAGDKCYTDADCQHACAGPPGFPSVCTDGNVGNKCRTDGTAQCNAGLHCALDAYPGTCTANEALGARCNADTDCLSQTCSRGTIESPIGYCIESADGGVQDAAPE